MNDDTNTEHTNSTERTQDETSAEPSRKELPFHKRFALFLGGISALTAGFYLLTGTGSEAQLVGFTVLIIVAIGMWSFGGRT